MTQATVTVPRSMLDELLKSCIHTDASGVPEGALMDYVTAMQTFLAAPSPAVAEAKDAARYRWLKTRRPQPMWGAIPVSISRYAIDDEDSIDHAIDAAMAADKET